MGMLNLALFFLIIFLAHIMQGVTGFAGTLLAMPLSLMLVGYPVAKPILNVLGLVSGIYVFLGNKKHVVWKELWKIVIIMGAGILAGIRIKDLLLGREKLLYLILGIFIVVLSIQGLVVQLRKKEEGKEKPFCPLLYLTLPIGGIIHGIFVTGGPLLISYLTKKVPDKNQFRATVSTVWIFLNSMVLFDDLRHGYWQGQLVLTALAAAPFLFGGLKVGSILYRKMSQRTFMILTYALLLVMGIKLLF